MKYIVFILTIIIIVGTILLFVLPTPNPNIKITSVHNGDTITSPLMLEGKARGTWFFEGDAPLILIDENDNILAESYITATGDWMTEDFVLFTGIITFERKEGKGTLIFKKDNPTGIPKYDESVEIKINF